MIEILRQDLNLLYNSYSQPPKTCFEENKVILAVTRVCGSALMVCNGFKAITAVPVFITGGGMIGLIGSLALCALGHDVFVMARNITKMHGPEGLFHSALAILEALRMQDTKAGDQRLARSITEGTILPIWQVSHPLWIHPVTRFFAERCLAT